jgi:hypothetical protein
MNEATEVQEDYLPDGLTANSPPKNDAVALMVSKWEADAPTVLQCSPQLSGPHDAAHHQ